MRLVIVEDHLLICDQIRRACAGEAGWEIVGKAGTGEAAIELIARVRPDTIVLDLALAGVMSGLAVAEGARVVLPAMRILVLSQWLRANVVLNLDAIGVQGYVSKREGSPAILRAALAAVAGGGTWFSADYREFKRACCADPLGAAKILSPRERGVLALAGACKNDDEIGDIMDIAPSTAQWHRSNLLLRLNLKGTPQLIAYSQNNGFALMAGDIICEMANKEIAAHAAAKRAGGGGGQIPSVNLSAATQ